MGDKEIIPQTQCNVNDLSFSGMRVGYFPPFSLKSVNPNVNGGAAFSTSIFAITRNDVQR